MKRKQIKIMLIATILGLMVAQCKIRKKPELEPVPFNYPDDITEAGKPEFLKTYNKGHLVYLDKCSKCHSKLENGKTIIPDFSLPQLMDYEIRIMYPSHQEPMTETNISVDELDWVVTFLRYKKPNS